MSIEAAIGIDCGTSYLKLSIVERNGIEYAQRRVPSPRLSESAAYDVNYADSLWRAIQGLLEAGVMHASASSKACLALAIAAISPVLVLFDPSFPHRSLTMPYWYIPRVDEATRGLERSIRRLRLLRHAGVEAGLSQPVLCDLIGYLNYRLTTQLSMNSITAGELGFHHRSQLGDEFMHSNPRVSQVLLQSPSQTCGVTQIGRDSQQLIVCAGSADSFAAAVSANSVRAGSRMIYLGTFGSLLEILDDLPPLVSGDPIPRHPYRWRLSVPGFGAAVEAYARTFFADDTLRRSLQRLDLAASSAPPGARGVLFHLPNWDSIGSARGSFGFEGGRRFEEIPSAIGARAVLEAIAYAASSRMDGPEKNVQRVELSGGGAQSEAWRQIIADVLGVPLASPRHAAGAWGAASIAFAALGWDINSLPSPVVTAPNLSAHADTRKTAMDAMHWYRRDFL